MKEKKRHEVSRLASFIQSVYVRHQCGVIADIGCGLGYLGQILSRIYDIDVIGFEMSEANCERARVHGVDTTSKVLQLSVNDSQACTNIMKQCISEFTEARSAKFGQCHTAVCLVGLHCCGDLTPSVLKQFCEMDECKALVCMGCCYHRMNPIGSNNHDHIGHYAFTNFPLSSAVRNITEKYPERAHAVSLYALRQACQETKKRWVSECHIVCSNVCKKVSHDSLPLVCRRCDLRQNTMNTPNMLLSVLSWSTAAATMVDTVLPHYCLQRACRSSVFAALKVTL